jgi:hypothetical protein
MADCPGPHPTASRKTLARPAADVFRELVGISAIGQAGRLGDQAIARLIPARSAAVPGRQLSGSGPGPGVWRRRARHAAPRNSALELRFDRPLLSANAVRQAILLYSGTPEGHAPFTQPEYDVVERVLLYRPLGALAPKTTYTVELIIPEEGDSEGFRAFDGAPLEEGPVPLRFDFHTDGFRPGPSPTRQRKPAATTCSQS